MKFASVPCRDASPSQSALISTTNKNCLSLKKVIQRSALVKSSRGREAGEVTQQVRAQANLTEDVIVVLRALAGQCTATCTSSCRASVHSSDFCRKPYSGTRAHTHLFKNKTRGSDMLFCLVDVFLSSALLCFYSLLFASLLSPSSHFFPSYLQPSAISP